MPVDSLCFLPYLIVSYQIFTPEDFKYRFTVIQPAVKVSKHPWDQLGVGFGFFIPHTDLTLDQVRSGYRPTAPDRLTRMGWKFQSRKGFENTNGQQVPGIIIARVA